MTFLERDRLEVDALITDRYLDALLAGATLSDPSPADAAGAVDSAIRLASRRLSHDLPRFHPSFRFEERLALRLAEAAVSLRLPAAAGAEGEIVALRPSGFDPLLGDPDALHDRADDDLVTRIGRNRPLIIGGALTASALSIAGAALVAWRRSRPSDSPMARAARAAHAGRGRNGGGSAARLAAGARTLALGGVGTGVGAGRQAGPER